MPLTDARTPGVWVICQKDPNELKWIQIHLVDKSQPRSFMSSYLDVVFSFVGIVLP